MKSSTITIYGNNKTKITIAHLDDLQMLPDKSIEVLFNNKNYMETIYVYVLYKLNAYLDTHHYVWEVRALYFNGCLDIIPKLIKHQKDFLSGKDFFSDKAFDDISEEIATVHRNCLEDVCNFFSGILSTTPYLKSGLFPKKELLLMKHNYISMFQLLRNL